MERTPDRHPDVHARRLQALVDGVGGMIWIAAPDGRLLTDMPAWREVTGQGESELLGFGWLSAIHADDRPRVDESWRRAVASGERYVVDYRLVARDGSEMWLVARAAPVVDPDGQIREWVGSCVDVTEERRLHHALADEQATLRQVVEQAPAAVAVTWGPEHRFRFFNDRYLEIVPNGRVEVGAPVGDALPEAAEAVLPLLDRALAGQRVELPELAVPFADARSFRGHRYYDVVLVPILRDGHGVGVSVTAREITEQVRVRVDLQERLSRERETAELMQRAIVPERLPDIPELDLSARYLPAGRDIGVGGDWYDVIEAPGDKVLLIIGDVAGRGIEAATIMSEMRAAVRAFASEDPSPASVLRRLSAYSERLHREDMVTVALALLDLVTGELEHASAGHPSPVACLGESPPRFLSDQRSLPIGVQATSYPQGRATAAPGDLVVLYTDGLVEERTRSLQATMEELRCLVDCDAPSAATVCDEIIEERVGDRPLDDVAVLVCHLRALREGAPALRLVRSA
ncbi:MAG TPA: SpoIIE family protein phosphatase [Capillimicrobium sp.]|jgi:PAS domain S-box-containing protein